MLSRPKLSLSHLLLVVVFVAALSVVVLLFLSPGIVDKVARQQLKDAGIDADFQLSKLTIFSTLIERAEVKVDAAKIKVDTVDAIYSPVRLIQKKRVDAVSIAGLAIEVSLPDLVLPESSDDPIQVIPDALSTIPVEQLLISSSSLLLVGEEGQERDFVLEGMFSHFNDRVDLAVNLEGRSDIESVLLSLSDDGTSGEIRAKGSISNIKPWLKMAMSVAAPTAQEQFNVRKGNAEFDIFAQASAKLLARWAGTLTLQNLEIEFNDLVVPIQRMVLGATGNAETLATASVAGRILELEWGDFKTSPFTLYGTAHSTASATAEIESIAISYHRLSVDLTGLFAEMVRHDDSSVTANASGLITSWSLPFRASYRQPAVGGGTATLQIPASQMKAFIPHGALPWTTFPLEAAGGIAAQAELKLATEDDSSRLDGTFTAKALNFSSDAFNVQGLSSSLAFALSSSSSRLSTDVLSIDSVTVSEMPIRNIRMGVNASYPGDTIIRDFRLNIFGGDVRIPNLKLSLAPDSTPAISEPANISINSLDLNEAARAFLTGWSIEGKIDLNVKVTPDAVSSYSIESEVALTSQALNVATPIGAGATVDSLLLAAKADATAVNLRTLQPLNITYLSYDTVSYWGKTSVSADITVNSQSLPEEILLEGTAHLTLADERIQFADTATIVGLSTEAHIELGGPKLLRSLTADRLQVKSVELGQLSVTEIQASSLSVTPEKVRAGPITAKFFGGTISISEVSGGLDNLTAKISFTNVDSAQLVKNIPQFEGELQGPFNGYLKLKRIEGGVAIVGGELLLPPGQSGRLVYPALADLIGTDDTVVMRNIRRSLEDLRLTALNLRLDPKADDGIMARLMIKGAGVQKNSPPVDLDLKLQGDVGETVKLIFNTLIGDGFNITFGVPEASKR